MHALSRAYEGSVRHDVRTRLLLDLCDGLVARTAHVSALQTECTCSACPSTTRMILISRWRERILMHPFPIIIHYALHFVLSLFKKNRIARILSTRTSNQGVAAAATITISSVPPFIYQARVSSSAPFPIIFNPRRSRIRPTSPQIRYSLPNARHNGRPHNPKIQVQEPRRSSWRASFQNIVSAIKALPVRFGASFQRAHAHSRSFADWTTPFLGLLHQPGLSIVICAAWRGIEILLLHKALNSIRS